MATVYSLVCWGGRVLRVGEQHLQRSILWHVGHEAKRAVIQHRRAHDLGPHLRLVLWRTPGSGLLGELNGTWRGNVEPDHAARLVAHRDGGVTDLEGFADAEVCGEGLGHSPSWGRPSQPRGSGVCVDSTLGVARRPRLYQGSDIIRVSVSLCCQFRNLCPTVSE